MIRFAAQYVLVGSFLLSQSVCFGTDDLVKPLLKTHWAQGGPYAQYTPENQRLGCWSVAFAQILHHHRIQPCGKIEYEGDGYKINETLDHEFNWQYFVKSLTTKTPQVVRSEVALYCYYAAIACKKDFKEGKSYLGNSDVRRRGVEEHFRCKTRRYRKMHEGDEVVRDVILSELKEGRPLLLYVEGEEGLCHAFVIDGVKVHKHGLIVHLNCGWNGADDGWYIFSKPFKTSRGVFSRPERWVLQIQPIVLDDETEDS